MRNLYREFFHISKDGKIREKVMLTRVFITVTVCIVCLIAMGLSAYAYFSYDVTSPKNLIQSASFETEVKINVSNKNGAPVDVTTGDDKAHEATLKAEIPYFITLELTDNNTANTGFVIVTAEGSEERYHTQQLGVDGEETTGLIEFTIILEADAKVSFIDHWGTSSYYGYETDSEQYIIDGETVTLKVDKSSTSDKKEEDNVKKPTPPQSTAPINVVHKVAAGETLADIAALYNTTVARIAAYNKLADPAVIKEGDTVKIPPADWVMPQMSTPNPTPPAVTTPPETEIIKPEETTPPDTSVQENPTVPDDPVDTDDPAPPTEPTDSTEVTDTPDTPDTQDGSEPIVDSPPEESN